jgi:hypothetical protein
LAEVNDQRHILHFAPRGKLLPQGWILTPSGEVIPWVWNSLFATPFLETVKSVHPWGGMNKGVTIPPWGQISPLGAKFTPGG